METPAGPQVLSSAINSRDVKPFNFVSLTIIAVLTVVLHLASAVVLDRSHASPATVTQDDEPACPAPQQPSLPYD